MTEDEQVRSRNAAEEDPLRVLELTAYSRCSEPQALNSES